MTARPPVETFSITTEAVEAVEADVSRASRLMTAQGALTELGGELTLASVISLLDVGVLKMTLDLTKLTCVEDAGLVRLRWAWLRVDNAGGFLWTVGVPEPYRELVPTSPPCLVDSAQHRDHSLPAAAGPGACAFPAKSTKCR